jgi:hypothetical protein
MLRGVIILSGRGLLAPTRPLPNDERMVHDIS